MQIENHKEEVPFAHYEAKFSELNPADAVARLPGVIWKLPPVLQTLFSTRMQTDFALWMRKRKSGERPPALF